MIKSIKSIFIYAMLFVLSFALFACNEPELKPSLTINSQLSVMKIGETVELDFTVVDFDGNVVVTSSDPTIISVSNKTLEALKEGSVTITVKAGDIQKELTITVKKIDEGNQDGDGDEKEEKYVVTFVDAEGKELKKEEVLKGASATAPTIDDPLFKGWDKEFSNVQSDLTVTALYKKAYSIRYVLNAGEFANASDEIKQYIEGEEVKLATPVKEGYDFLGWTLSRDSVEYISKISSDQTGDLTIYANWQKQGPKSIVFDFNGGISQEFFMKNIDKCAGSFIIDNFNNVHGGFWESKNYEKYVHMNDSSKDPKATFSDRIYIGKDSETGFYKILSILTSGGSSWPAGAEWVISISSSYNSYSSVHKEVLKLKVGMTVVFDGDYTKFSTYKPGKVYFFDEDPTFSTITYTIEDEVKEFATPVMLGGTFVGWYDADGNKIESFDDTDKNLTVVKAKWDLLNPVTEINISSICEEMLTASTYQIVANVVPADAYFTQILYSTSDPDIVNVDENGKLTSLNAGTAVITITDYVKNIVIEKTITVNPIDSVDIKFEEGYNGILNIGETVQLSPVAVGKGANNIKFKYSSSNPDILEVSSDGLVTAKGLGTASILIADENNGVFRLSVGITVDPLDTTAAIDKLLALIAKNNFATVDTGNMCLYNDGTQRYYDSMYGSVNRYLFSPFEINREYADDAESYTGGHKDRRFTGGFNDVIEFVTVHDTATLTGTVQSIASNMSSGETSIHYTVGNDAIYQVVPEKYIAYHAGDGTGTPFTWNASGVPATGIDVNDYRTYPKFSIEKSGSDWYWVINGTKSNIKAPISNGTKTIANPGQENITDLGPSWKIVDGEIYLGNTWVCFTQFAKGAISSFGGNNNSIGIEMCVNTNGDIYDTLQRTAQLVADILIRNNLDLSRVKMHNTWSGKNCPQVLRAGNYWWDFIDMVVLNYEIMKNYPNAKITMQSDNTSIVDNTGRVVKAPNTTTTVSYTVTVELGGQSKSIKLYSVIPGATTWQQWNGRYPSSLIWNEGNYKR